MTDFVGDAVGQRMAGGTPSWFKSVGAALIIGIGAAMLAYRLLRNKSDSDDSDDSEESADSEESS